MVEYLSAISFSIKMQILNFADCGFMEAQSGCLSDPTITRGHPCRHRVRRWKVPENKFWDSLAKIENYHQLLLIAKKYTSGMATEYRPKLYLCATIFQHRSGRFLGALFSDHDKRRRAKGKNNSWPQLSLHVAFCFNIYNSGMKTRTNRCCSLWSFGKTFPE